MTVVLVVTGDRFWTNRAMLNQALDEEYAAAGGHLVLVEGEAPGADTMAREWAEQRRVPVDPYPAKWRVTVETPRWRIRKTAGGRLYDVAAGPLRNQQIIDEGEPTKGIVFHEHLDRSTGTADMVERLESAGIPIRFVPRDTRPNVQMKLDDAAA